MEKPEKSKMRIVHIKDRYTNPEDQKGVFKIDNNNLKNLKFEDPKLELEFKKLLKDFEETTDIEEKKRIEFVIRQLLLS